MNIVFLIVLFGASVRRVWNCSGLLIIMNFTLSGVAGCSLLSADNCSIARQASEIDGGTGCRVAEKARSALFAGDDFPRLWSGEAERQEPNVDVRDLNQLPVTRTVGYFGTLRVDYTRDDASIRSDVEDIARAKGNAFDPGETVAIHFERATLDFFLNQMMRGALGLAYVAPDDLGGSVTFRTEAPLPKSQVLQVTRDVLGRHGLVMKLVNGIYHIDRADVLNALEQATRQGRDVERRTRIVHVRKGSAAEIAGFVRQLVSENVLLLPSNGGDAIVVKADAADLERVSDMIGAMAGGAIGEDRVAVVPLRNASPEKLASQIQDVYKGRAEGLSIMPLEGQRSLIITTRDPRIMAGVRSLVRELDSTVSDDTAVRIIPLTHLQADDIAQRLGPLMASGNPGDTRSGPANAVDTSPTSQSAAGSPFGALSASRGSPASQRADPSAVAASGDSRSRGAPDSNRPTGRPDTIIGAGPSGGTTRIVPDGRNNTLIVSSTYAVFKRLQDVVKALDVPQAQVVIEATIAEVTITDDLKFGVETYLSGHGFTGRNSAGSSAPSDSGGAGTYANIGFMAAGVSANIVLTALQAVTTVKVISSPYLTVIDKKTARLVIGDQIPFTQSTQTSNSTAGTTVTESTDIKETGVILEVTPQINSDNSLVLTVDQQISTPSDSVATGNKTPIIANRQVKSEILLQSGRTFLLGGIMQERIDKSDSGMPVLSAVPGLGDLLKTQENKATRVELLVMITPRVVRQAGEIEKITRLLRDQAHIH